MANRSYLYSLSNRPSSYADRPKTISGLSEWPWGIPFSYRVLMSGDPQRCASLVSDGFEDDPPKKKTKLFAISSDFKTGFARLKKFCNVLRPLAAGSAPGLISHLDETLSFLQAHRDRYFLLETIELDCMIERKEAKLRACVEREVKECLRAGAAIDALPDNVTDAGKVLKKSAKQRGKSPLNALLGVRLDDHCDNTREKKTNYPLGLSWWTDVLFFELWNRAQFEAHFKRKRSRKTTR